MTLPKQPWLIGASAWILTAYSLVRPQKLHTLLLKKNIPLPDTIVDKKAHHTPPHLR